VRSDCCLIAEIGSNHNRDLAEAHRLIDIAAEAGWHVAKFQTYSADTLYSPFAPRLSEMATFQGDDGVISPYELIARLEMPRDWHGELAGHCTDVGLEFMSTAFDLAAVDELDPLVWRHKVASFDLTNKPLLERIATTGKPVVVSTGHAYLSEVDEALRWLRDIDPQIDVTLLHCTSQYPTDPHDVHLRAMTTLERAFAVDVGLSDHTLTNAVSIAAVARGAKLLERHVTRDRRQPGPDHRFALEPDAMAELAAAVRDVEAALGSATKQPTSSEAENRLLARRSIHAARKLDAGHVLRSEDLIMLRPGTGIPPDAVDIVVGRELRKPLTAGELLTWDVV
jgi:N-acetylneuraminate synthase/N,N'-diacetyllegionaminate synthase